MGLLLCLEIWQRGWDPGGTSGMFEILGTLEMYDTRGMFETFGSLEDRGMQNRWLDIL